MTIKGNSNLCVNLISDIFFSLLLFEEWWFPWNKHVTPLVIMSHNALCLKAINLSKAFSFVCLHVCLYKNKIIIKIKIKLDQHLTLVVDKRPWPTIPVLTLTLTFVRIVDQGHRLKDTFKQWYNYYTSITGTIGSWPWPLTYDLDLEFLTRSYQGHHVLNKSDHSTHNSST